MILSVVVPVHNNVCLFAGCLASMMPLLRSGEVEVVVVDDGSSAAEAQRLHDIVADVSAAVTIVSQPHLGAAVARNRAIGVAHGRFLWFVDADDTLHEPAFDSLLATLHGLPDGCDVLCMGGMIELHKQGCVPSACPQAPVAVSISKASLLVPHTSCLDHTTLAVRRSLLLANPSVRYAEGMSLLEDSVFSLRVVEAAGNIFINPSLHAYIHHSYRPSTTSGPWDVSRSAQFLPDICLFFGILRQFRDRHPECQHLSDLYRRYRYVYLRVLAVKGCPWSDIEQFRSSVAPLDKPFSSLEALLFFAPVHRLMAFVCRVCRTHSQTKTN